MFSSSLVRPETHANGKRIFWTLVNIAMIEWIANKNNIWGPKYRFQKRYNTICLFVCFFFTIDIIRSTLFSYTHARTYPRHALYAVNLSEIINRFSFLFSLFFFFLCDTCLHVTVLKSNHDKDQTCDETFDQITSRRNKPVCIIYMLFIKYLMPFRSRSLSAEETSQFNKEFLLKESRRWVVWMFYFALTMNSINLQETLQDDCSIFSINRTLYTRLLYF